MRWLVEYVTEASSEHIGDLLVFITAKRTIPPWGLEKPIIVKFLADNKIKMLPEATTCFFYIADPCCSYIKNVNFLNTWTWLYDLRVMVSLQKVIELESVLLCYINWNFLSLCWLAF